MARFSCLVPRTLLVFAIALSSFDVLAQAVRIGPEAALPQSQVTEAALGQSGPAAASDGRDFFVVWMDYRRGSAIADVFGTIVGSDGSISEHANVAVSTSMDGQLYPDVVWNGSEYLVAYNQYSTYAGQESVAAATVDRDGVVTARDIDLSALGAMSLVGPQLASSGGTTLLGWYRRGDFLVDRTSLISGHTATAGPTLPHWASAVVPWGSGFLVIGRQSPQPKVVASAVSRGGAVQRTITVTDSLEVGERSVVAASSGSEVLVAAPTAEKAVLFLISGTSTVRTIGEIPIGWVPVTVSWSGSEFVVSWVATGASKEVLATRYSRSGQSLDATPLVVYRSSVASSWITSAGAGGNVLIAFNENSGYRPDMDYRGTAIVGAVVNGGSFASHEMPAALQLSRSPYPQLEAALTASPGGYFSAWRELIDASTTTTYGGAIAGPVFAAYLGSDGTARERMALDEGVSTSGAMATASGPDGEVAMWSDSQGSPRGVVLDRQSHALRKFALASLKTFEAPAITADTDGYRIAVSSYGSTSYAGETVLVRLSRDLIEVGPPLHIADGLAGPAMIRDGDALIVATGTSMPGCMTLCPAGPPPEIRLSRLTPDGTRVRDVVVAKEYGGQLSMACGPVCVLAWEGQAELAYVTFARDLQTVSERHSIPRANPVNFQRVVWDGNRFVAAWSESMTRSNEVQLATISASGEASAAMPITSVDTTFSSLYSPAPRAMLASRGDGTSLLMYGRFDASATGGGVRRLFARTLSLLSKRRATSH